MPWSSILVFYSTSHDPSVNAMCLASKEDEQAKSHSEAKGMQHDCSEHGVHQGILGAAFVAFFASSKHSITTGSEKGSVRARAGSCNNAEERSNEASSTRRVIASGPDGPDQESRYKTREQEAYNHIAKYAKPDDGVAVRITAQTLFVYVGLFYLSYTYNGPMKWPVSAVLTILCGLTRTRVFCLMHDMAHHSFFSSKMANIVGATLLGALVYTPYSGWKKGHDYHHRHSNNTDRKQTAQTAPITVQQYKSFTRWHQMAYKMIYGHWSLVTTTPWLYFVIVQRLMSKWYENLLVAIYWAWIVMMWDARLLATDMLTAAIGASMGVFLFHIQHTFEGAYKASDGNYSRYENGMYGSSYLIVPEFLKFFTASIEYHNVHHLNTRVPLYRLRQCFEEGSSVFSDVPTFTMWEAVQRLPYSLRHDEDFSFVSCYDEDAIAQLTEAR